MDIHMIAEHTATDFEQYCLCYLVRVFKMWKWTTWPPKDAYLHEFMQLSLWPYSFLYREMEGEWDDPNNPFSRT